MATTTSHRHDPAVLLRAEQAVGRVPAEAREPVATSPRLLEAVGGDAALPARAGRGLEPALALDGLAARVPVPVEVAAAVRP